MRDIRQRGWFWIENELIDRTDLSFEEKAMYMILARFTDKDGKCFPSIEKLSESIGKNKRTVIRYIKKLEEKGLIEKKRRFNQTNVYYLKNVALNSDKLDNDKNDSDKDVTSLGDTGVASDSDKNDTLTIPIEQYPINNTQYKEKYKKEKFNNLECFVNSLEKTEKYKTLIFEYIKYRKEIRKNIKTLRPLKKILKDFPSEIELAEAIEIAKEREWTGLEPEWIENYKNNLGGNNNGNTGNKRFNKRENSKHTEEPDYSKGFEDWN
jgi:gp69 protein